MYGAGTMGVKADSAVTEPRVEALLAAWFDVDVHDPAAVRERMRRWFSSTADEDRELERRFGALGREAARGALDALAGTPRGRLGLIILHDQLPRNLHRGQAAAFAGDARALELCLDGIRAGHDLALSPLERVFFLMPLQHAEDPGIQSLSVERYAALAREPAAPALAAALASSADYAVAHRDIVLRFGRFPHRNRALGRESTAAELDFLAAGGASFGQ